MDQAFHHVQLIEDRRLHGHSRPLRRMRRCGRGLATAAQVEQRQQQGIGPVDGQGDGHHGMKQR
jgi:hypothetical protein